jgi:hypothetical protein
MNVTGGLPLRGKTWLAGNAARTLTSGMADHLEGTTKVFDDVDPTLSTGAKTRRSNRQVTCMLVRNVSGTTLLPKRVVTWKAGYRGKQVDGYCTTDAQECAGVVDEFLPAGGVANNDLFWIVVKGPTLVLNGLAGDATNAIAAGDKLIALTAATSQSVTSGRVQAMALTSTSTGTTDGSHTKAIVNRFGVAMSAKTAAQIDADVLADTNFGFA